MIIGIHLGANYTRVGIKNDDPPHILRDVDIPREGNADRLASVVSFYEDRIKVGTDGLKNQEQEIVFDACKDRTDYDNIEKVIWHAKREDGTYLVKKGSAKISQEDIVSLILNRIKKIFEERKYGPIKNLVISTPYDCEDAYRTMIKNAANKAEFNQENLVLIEETKAAAKGFYELSVPNQYPHNLLVFKFGAGSFSISLVQKQSKNDRLEILKTRGSPQLGGEDITNLLMQYFLKNNEKDLAEIRRKDLRESCERVKSDLSYFPDTKIIIDDEPLIDINRDIFDGICKNIIAKIQKYMHSITSEMKAKKIEIHDVLLVGGSTRLHFIRKIIDSALKSAQKSEYRYDTVVIAEEAIALGCAIHGSELSIEVEHAAENAESRVHNETGNTQNAQGVPNETGNMQNAQEAPNETGNTQNAQEAPNETGNTQNAQGVPNETSNTQNAREVPNEMKCENKNPQSNINSTDQVNVTLIETLPNNQSKVERRDISPNGVVNPAHHNNQTHDHRTEIPQPVPSHRTESVAEKTKPGNPTVVGNFVNFPSKQAASTTNLVKPPPNPAASGTSYGPQNREPLRANSKDKEPFMDSPIKRKLYEQTTKWYNKIKNYRHLSDEEKAHYQTNYCNKYIQRLRDDYLEESKGVGEDFLAVAERRYQELRYKNDILEQFEKIQDKLGYISDEDLKRRCKFMLNARRLEVYDTSIKNNEQILEHFLKEIQIELCLRPEELKNPAQNLKPKVFEWLELEIRNTLIMPKLYYCKYKETKKYKV